MMKRKFLFSLIFLLCCGWLDAHLFASPMESSERSLNIEASLPPDSLPWTNDFEQCWVPENYNTGSCGRNTAYNPNSIGITWSGANQVAARDFPYQGGNEEFTAPAFLAPHTGKTYLTVKPLYDETGYLPNWPVWLFTPIFELKQGKTYTFSFWYAGNTANELLGNGGTILVKGGEVIDVGGEDGVPSAGLMTVYFDSIAPSETRYRQCKVSYTPERDMKFSFALYCRLRNTTVRNTNMGAIPLDDFEVAELPGSPEPKEPIAKAKIGAIDVQWSKPDGPTDPTGYILEYKRTDQESYQTISTTSTSWNLTGLDEGKEYTIGVRAVYGTHQSLLSPEVLIYTYVTPATVFPFVENFETEATYGKWIFVQRKHAQYWVVGDSAKGTNGSRSLYSISTRTRNQPGDIGIKRGDFQYKGSINGAYAESSIFAYRDLQFPEGNGFRVRFNYRGQMTGSLKGAIYLVDTNYVLREGGVIPQKFLLKEFITSQANWTADMATINPILCSGKTKRLVIAWIMTSSVDWTATPLAIDNIVVETACPELNNFAFAGFDNTSIKTTWEAPTEVTQYQVEYKLSSAASWTSGGVVNTKNYTFPTGAANAYDMRVRGYCSAIAQSDWQQISKIFTPQLAPKMVPFVETFDSISNNHGSDWAMANGVSNNWYRAIDKWNGNEDNYSAFIGINNQIHRYIDGYAATDKTTNHLYRDITFPAVSNGFLLSFDWTAYGAINPANSVFISRDYLKVSLVDIDDPTCAPIVGNSSSDSLGIYWGRDTLAPMANAKFVLNPADYAGKTKRLIFTWVTDGSRNSPAPYTPFSAAIDNIRVDALSCLPPHNIVAKLPDQSSIILSWGSTAPVSTMKYRAYDATQGPDENWNNATVDNINNLCKLEGLGSNRIYEFSLQSNACGRPFDTTFTVHSAQIPVSLTETYTEDFENLGSDSYWTALYPPPADFGRDRWKRGTGANLPEDGENNKMYISTTEWQIVGRYGEENNYSSQHLVQPTYYYLYRELIMPENAKECKISFDWKLVTNAAAGNHLRAYLIDIDTPLLPFALPQQDPLGNKALWSANTVWTKETFFVPITQGGSKTKRLVFAYQPQTNAVPAVAVDNIAITALPVSTPTNLKVTTVPPKSLKIEWEYPADSSFVIAYQKENTTTWLYDTVKVDISASPKTYILELNSPNTYYEIMVKVNRAGAGWTLPVTGITSQIIASADGFVEKFEDIETSKQWTLINSGQKNRWYRGNFGRSKPIDSCLYVDMNKGTTNFYDRQASIIHAYRDIEFGNNDYYTLSYDWRGLGNSGTDYLKVYLVDIPNYPVAGSKLPDAAVIDSKYGSVDWLSSTVNLPASVKGTTKRIVFSWENSGTSAVAQPPASIDNIRIDRLNCPPPKDVKLVGTVAYDSLRISWGSITDNGYQVRYRIVGEGEEDWVLHTTAEKTLRLQGLDQNTPYEIQVQANCDVSGVSAWSSSFAATTNLTAVTLPFIEDFERTVPALKIANGLQNNRWVLGSAANADEGLTGKSLFISPDGGAHYTYALAATKVHAYRDVVFPANAAAYALSFDWKVKGYQGSDNMKVYLTNTNVTPTAGNAIPYPNANVYLIGRTEYTEPYYNTLVLFKGDTIYLPDTLAGKTKRLVFSWSNAVLSWNPPVLPQPNPPVAIDNIKFVPLSCARPTNLNAICLAIGEAKLSWSAGADANFTVYYRKKGDVSWAQKDNQPNPVTLTGLDANIEYEYQVLNTCPADTGNAYNYKSALGTFTTWQELTDLPFDEDFQEPVKRSQWTLINGFNKWVIATNNLKSDGRHYLYVTKGNGQNNWSSSYHQSNARYSHAYRDINFGSGNTEGFKVSFAWINQGSILNTGAGRLSSDRDNFQVFLVDRDLTLDPTKEIPHKYLLSEKKFCNPSEDKALLDSIYIPGDISGTKRLVFRWMDSMRWSGNIPWRSALLEEVHVRANECSTPHLQVVQDLLDSVTFKWNASSVEGLSYILEYAETGSTKWKTQSIEYGSTMFGVQGLKPETSYTVRVIPQCGNNMPAEVVFTTPSRLTFFEGFNTDTVPNLWTLRWGFVDTNQGVSTDLFLSNYANGETQWQWRSPFANINGNSNAASINVQGADCSAWMISKDIYLEPNEPIELSFKLGVAGRKDQPGTAVTPTDLTTALDDKFGVFISGDDHWRMQDTLAFWNNTGSTRSFKAIANTAQGERITIPIQGRKGRFKIAFYAESAVGNASNTIYLDSILIRRPSVCEPVSELKVSEITPFTAKATWTGDYYQKQYGVRWNLQVNGSEIGNGLVSKTDTLMRGLLPSKTYTVEARGICAGSTTSTWSQAISFRTPSDCANVTNITSIPDSNSAVISWSKNGSNKVGYEYRIGTADKTVDQLTSTSIADTMFTAPGLTAATDYVVYIRPICSDEDTGSWATYNFRTLNLACGVPSQPTISAITSTSAIANWTAGYRSESYEFFYGNSEAIANMNKVSTINTSATMSNLRAGNTYYYAVRAICANSDTSDLTAIASFNTLSCTPIKNLSVIWNEASTEATVAWRTEGGQTQWEVHLVSSDGSNDKNTIVNDSSYIIKRSDLNPNLGYTVEVRTVCGDNTSSYSESKTVVLLSIPHNTLPEGVRVNISPNPATDYAKLSIEGVEGNVTVELFSMKGELITSEILNCNLTNAKELSLSGLSKGAYTIRLTHEKWSKTEKLIVK